MDDQVREELDRLAAETLALQTLFVCACKTSIAADPNVRETLEKAFSDAANVVVNHAIERGTGARPGHTLAAVQLVESLRGSVLRGFERPKPDI